MFGCFLKPHFPRKKVMLGISTVSIPIRLSNQSICKPATFIPPHNLNLPFKSRNPRKVWVHAGAGENGKGVSKERENEHSSSNGDGGDEDPNKGNGRLRFNMRWFDLLVDPDPDNLVAVGLTGLLTWASVQVLWQLLLISLAILVAALKYSFIAALLIFILVTLL